MRLIAAGLLLLVPLTATAASQTFEWTYPTPRVDGSPQPTTGAGAFKSVRVVWGTCKDLNGDAFGVKEGEVVVDYPATSVTVDVTPGIKCALAYTLDNLDNPSPPSNLGRYFPAPAPVILKTSTKIAYELRKKADGDYTFVQVGTIPLAAKCGTVLAPGYAQVQGAKITKPLKGGAIAGKCS